MSNRKKGVSASGTGKGGNAAETNNQYDSTFTLALPDKNNMFEASTMLTTPNKNCDCVLPFKDCCSKGFIFQFLTLAITLLLCWAGFYLYLDKMYIVDEILDGEGPRELSIYEKFTIRIRAPADTRDLHEFVKEYTICKPVHHIQILWDKLHTPAPSADSFTYLHTHSKVTVYHASPRVSFSARSSSAKDDVPQGGIAIHDTLYSLGVHEIDTQGVLLLDADVLIPCKHLMFMHSVWRSSKDALVGVFPRLVLPVSTSSNTADDSAGAFPVYEMHGWRSILWHNSYNFMLPAGVIIDKNIITTLSSGMRVRNYLWKSPHCADYALPLWAALRHRAPPPIFADVAVKINAAVGLSSYQSITTDYSNRSGNLELTLRGLQSRKEPLSAGQQSLCVTDLIGILRQQKQRKQGNNTSSAAATLTPPKNGANTSAGLVKAGGVAELGTEALKVLSQLHTVLPVAHFKSTIAKDSWLW